MPDFRIDATRADLSAFGSSSYATLRRVSTTCKMRLGLTFQGHALAIEQPPAQEVHGKVQVLLLARDRAPQYDEKSISK
jgi:hypothetical protein